MLLVHCSSSSSPAGTGDAGHPTSGSGSGTTAGSQSSSATTGHTGTSTAQATSTGTGTGHTSSSSSTGGGSGSGSCPGGPVGGAPCTPGELQCPGPCAVPSNHCCQTGTGTGSGAEQCQTATETCSGNRIECNGKADCPDGEICCLDVKDINGDFSITCQQGTTCPSSIYSSAQLCTTNAECPGGVCNIYSCQDELTQACESPSAIGCTQQGH